jgi:hypothetical protein
MSVLPKRNDFGVAPYHAEFAIGSQDQRFDAERFKLFVQQITHCRHLVFVEHERRDQNQQIARLNFELPDTEIQMRNP